MKIIKELFNKAQDKVSNVTKGAVSVFSDGGNQQTGMPNLVNLSTKDKAGWVSPEYNQSKKVILNPSVTRANRCVAVLPNAPELEAYKLVRRKILNLLKAKGWNTIMITSALPGEGKTLTAINLSLTFAREFDHTTLLVDSDLRTQSVHSLLGINSTKGILDCLVNGTPISEVMLWPNIEKFTLISGGRLIQESAELLGSQKMKDLILEMKTRYPDRYVFFDAPPLLSVADALTLSALVDGVIVVVQAEKTSTDDVKRALEMIPKEKLLGLILNRQKDPLEDSLMRYYGYPKGSSKGD